VQLAFAYLRAIPAGRRHKEQPTAA